MKDGFVRCASATVDIKVADTDYNTSNIIKAIEDAAQNDIKLIVCLLYTSPSPRDRG